MKKHLALVLALVMVLSSFSFVSAAPDFSDMEGHENAEAVARLELLNVLKGYPDGTFKPDNTITRAEFAAVAVRVSGLENVAMAAKGLPTGFSDVPAWHWASGYVGTAAKMGIVNGIGNGLFAPETPVKYEEAITMVVRALGYEPMAQARGGYPFGYLIVANEIDLLDGAMGAQGTWATRAFVAQITDNALEIPMMIQVGFGTSTEWVVSGENDDTDEVFLLDRMGFDTVEGVVSDVDVEDMEVYIDDENDDDWYEVAEGFDFWATKDAEIKAWVDGDMVIAYSVNDEVLFDAVEYDEVDGETDEITLVTADEDYDVTRDVDNEFNADFEADFAKVVVNGDNEVSYVEEYDFDGFILVEEVDDELVIDLNDEELDVEDFLLVMNGKTISVEDLEKGDILFYVEDDIWDEDYEGLGVVYNYSETGMIDRLYSDSFRFEGDTYDVIIDYALYVDGDDLGWLDMDIVEGMFDEESEIEIFFDFKGDVAIIAGETGDPVEDSFIAALVETANVYEGRRGDMLALDVLTEEGAVVAYDLEWADIDTDVTEEHGIETLVEFELEDDDVVAVWVLDTIPADEFETDDRYVNGYRLQSDTLFFFVDDEEVVELADADFEVVYAGAEIYVDGGDVVAVVEPETDMDEDTTDYYGVVTEVRELRDGEAEFTIEVEGDEFVFVTEDEVDFADAVELEGHVGTLEVGDESEEVVSFELELPLVVDTIDVDGVSTTSKTLVVGGVEYKLISDAVVYDADLDQISMRDLEDGDTVGLYMDDSSEYYVAYVLVDDMTTPAGPPAGPTDFELAMMEAEELLDDADVSKQAYADVNGDMDEAVYTDVEAAEAALIVAMFSAEEVADIDTEMTALEDAIEALDLATAALITEAEELAAAVEAAEAALEASEAAKLAFLLEGYDNSKLEFTNVVDAEDALMAELEANPQVTADIEAATAALETATLALVEYTPAP
jgi:hypothetical protein